MTIDPGGRVTKDQGTGRQPGASSGPTEVTLVNRFPITTRGRGLIVLAASALLISGTMTVALARADLREPSTSAPLTTLDDERTDAFPFEVHDEDEADSPEAEDADEPETPDVEETDEADETEDADEADEVEAPEPPKAPKREASNDDHDEDADEDRDEDREEADDDEDRHETRDHDRGDHDEDEEREDDD